MWKLPYWSLTDTRPAFYDTESGSAIEQTAKVYGAMRDLIGEYNKFAETVNKTLDKFELEASADMDQFKRCITELVSNYIQSTDIKISLQNKEIAEAVAYMKEGLSAEISAAIAEMRDSGELSEVILNAFDNTAVKLEEVTARITTIENNMPYYQYNPDTEDLVLMNVPTKEV